MKRIFAIVFAGLLLISMVACQYTPQNTGSTDQYTVGVCQLVPHEALDAATKGFVDTLKAEFGDKIEIKVEVGGGDTATCAPIVNGFVAEDVDLIMANATPALQAAVAATADIPILGTSVTEYGVALDIDNFSGTVGTNVSGTSDLAPLKEQAAMVKEWFPKAEKVGLLYCSGEANSKYQVDTVMAELKALGLTCKAYPFTDSNDLQAVAQKAADDSHVIYAPTDNTLASAGQTVDSVCRAAGVPVISGEENACKQFGVATLSISYYNLGVTTGKMAIQILKGEAKISEMPIAYDEAPVKKYNKEICQAMGLTPPEGYVAIGE